MLVHAKQHPPDRAAQSPQPLAGDARRDRERADSAAITRGGYVHVARDRPETASTPDRPQLADELADAVQQRAHSSADGVAAGVPLSLDELRQAQADRAAARAVRGVPGITTTTPTSIPSAHDTSGATTTDSASRKRKLREWQVGTWQLPPGPPNLIAQPASYERRERVRELVAQRLGELADNERRRLLGGGDEKALRARLRAPELKQRRSLDRLAWVVEHLKDARECVAVTLTVLDGGPARVMAWANRYDDAIAADLQRLLTAARANADEAGDALRAALGCSKLGGRGRRPTDEQRAVAARRLRKTIAFLRAFEAAWGPLEPHIDHPKYVERKHLDDSGQLTRKRVADAKVHAEQRGGDLAKHAVLELRKAAIASGDAPTVWRATFGISKLCCYLCHRALLALAEVHNIQITTTGTHLHTYSGGWPIPEHLRDPEELRAFLGIPRRGGSDVDEELLEAIRDSRDFVLHVISGYDGSKGLGFTEYVSSEDEGSSTDVVRGRESDRDRDRDADAEGEGESDRDRDRESDAEGEGEGEGDHVSMSSEEEDDDADATYIDEEEEEDSDY